MLRFQLDTTGNLLKDLIAFWPLDEPGGQRRDMLGYNPLTDNATVTSAKGIGGQGTSAKFTAANSEYLSVSDNPQLSMGDIDFTMCSWVYFDSKPAVLSAIINKWSLAVGREYDLQLDTASDHFFFSVRNTANTANTAVEATNFGSPPLGLWIFIVIWHDSVNDQIAIQVNNGTTNTAATTGGVRDHTNDFLIGKHADGYFIDGRISEVGLWKRVLSQQERTDLYNFGRGNRLITY